MNAFPNALHAAVRADGREGEIARYAARVQSDEIEFLGRMIYGQASLGPNAPADISVMLKNNAYGRLCRTIERRGQEFYWTLTRLLGLGHLHDGSRATPQRVAERKEWRDNVSTSIERPRIFIDATRTHVSNLHTGMQRVVRNICDYALRTGEAMPFVLEDRTLKPLYRGPWPDRIELRGDDIVLLLDMPLLDDIATILSTARAADARVVCAIYDLIPLFFPGLCAPHFPDYFHEITDRLLSNVDGVVAISRTVAMDVKRYAPGLPGGGRDPRIGWNHLGADFAPVTFEDDRMPVPAKRFFLGVGTLEPRKAWDVAIDAMESLWASGGQESLVLVGRYGWNCIALRSRIETHRESGRRLFWIEDMEDARLAALYRAAIAIVYPSVVEGFGLPLVEAKHYGTPVIASDIPVFREIAGDAIDYFRSLDSQDLARHMIEAALTRPRTPQFPTLDWATASEGFLDVVRCVAFDRPHERRIA